ncbi:MAG: asparagine synthase (glutamine-hydrolyzing) [Sulfuricurvum sp.]|uniref:asparagine synthase (glutamine-hydrolyzing) n=1 Tax=Sulfuricurvum sp. TaxID=2025608 RepID=UPI00262EDDB8|nr:asparagine synthase (glutamine-hydrolyzing) [Sulfuricurvum sp.]MDD2370221.1 asparagine synthase (glutamine-hydrolyzing) [Sulfuricurvum sp.]MDD5117222.1 asparagine synthase (glutamine-hydrolyzing) [Sulfuricurvum sp.]
MCGVFGIIGDYSPHKAREALKTLLHRGRDHCGIIERDGVFLAHQRLSITDPHPRSHQPMSRGKRLISFNGEIYNHNELRKRLSLSEWESASDTEVILAAYEAWGIECVNHFEGMFAFALMDGEKFYLVRDRFGKKPLFYHQGKEAFVFASEIKAIKPFLTSVEMNKDALHSYLSFLAPTPPHTFYRGIEKLESGEWLCFEKNKLSKYRYYDVLQTPSSEITDNNEAKRRIEEELHRSIAIRLNTEAPTAALLSGGLDSAMICAIAARQGKKLPVYTLGYNEYGAYDERANAAVTADYLGLEHTEVIISQDDFHEHLDDLLIHMDEPLNDPAALPLYLLMKKIGGDGYKVVLSGEGSDELFLGYRQYFEYLDIEKAASLHHKNWLKKYFHSHFSMNREWEWYKRVFDDTLLFRTSGEKFTDLQQNKLFRQNVRDNESLRFLNGYRQIFEQSSHSDPSMWYSMIDLKLFVGEHFLAKLDRVSMAHTIEARTPFLDHRLAETVLSIDPRLRIGDGETKALLKQIARNYLSDAIIDRKKKGFANPYMEWLIASGRLELIREVNTKTGLFYPEVIEEYLDLARRGRFKQHVWGLYVLSHWINRELL